MFSVSLVEIFKVILVLGKMSFDSSYHADFKAYGEKASRPKLVTRQDVEARPDEHVPMFTETQNMFDYKYDPAQFRSVWVPKKVII